MWLSSFLVLTGPAEAGIDQSVASQDLQHMMFADEIGLQPDEPIILAGEYQ